MSYSNNALCIQLIYDYWKARGYHVRAHSVPQTDRALSVMVVASDLVLGLPPGVTSKTMADLVKEHLVHRDPLPHRRRQLAA